MMTLFCNVTRKNSKRPEKGRLPGSKIVIGDGPQKAPRETCRSFALERSWENSARQFIGNLSALQPSRSLRPARRVESARIYAGQPLMQKPAHAPCVSMPG